MNEYLFVSKKEEERGGGRREKYTEFANFTKAAYKRKKKRADR